jgi:hypothetical protein
MKLTSTAVLCLLVGTSLSPVRAQNGTDVCLAMVTDAAHSISLSTTSDSYYITLYNNYCNADGSVNDSAVNGSLSAIIKDVPIGLKGGSSDSKSQWSQFCSTEKSANVGSSSSYDYQSLVVGQALSSANQCLKTLSDHAYTMTYKVMTPEKMVVNFGVPSGQSIVIHGVTADTNVACTGSDLTNGGTFAYRQGIGQTIDASKGSTGISCARAPFTTVGSTPYYKEAAVEVDTNVGQLNIFWPKETVLPLTNASEIEKQIGAVSKQLDVLQSKVAFNALPIGTIVPWFQKNGNPPAGWVKCDGSDTAHCPNLAGVFLRGSAPSDVGSTGGSSSSSVGQHGSNNRRGDGNGWSIDGGHFMSNDNVTVNIIPPYASVLYIMKVSNQ